MGFLDMESYVPKAKKDFIESSQYLRLALSPEEKLLDDARGREEMAREINLLRNCLDTSNNFFMAKIATMQNQVDSLMIENEHQHEIVAAQRKLIASLQKELRENSQNQITRYMHEKQKERECQQTK